MRRFAAKSVAAAAGARTAVTVFSGTLDEFQKVVGAGPVVVDFFTEWCGPCKSIAPKFVELSEKAENKGVTFLKANVEENEELGSLFNIRSIPTFVAFKDGKPVGRVEGASLPAIENVIAAAAKSE
jgi:thioredoxin 1